MMETIKLSNGVEMPLLGYGVFLVSPQECERCVTDALSAGYRLIDTAQAYQNEEGVGAAITKSGIRRDELFLTTKVWISNAGEEKAAKSIDESLRKFQYVYPAAGDDHSGVRLTPDELKELSGAVAWVDVCKEK